MGAPHALIAGAGIGGLCAALCLARSGWRVTIFEAAATLEEVGAGLQLSPNASAILRRLGVLARLKPASLVPESIRIRRARDGATLVLMRLNDPEKRWGAPYLLAHRADLQRALLEAVADQPDIVLETGTALERFASGPDNVVAALRRGPNVAEIAGDCLIGADGWRSIVRAGLFGPSHRVEFARRTAWRALVPAQSVAPEMLRPQCSLWLGHRAHLVHYPLRAGAVVNVVAVIGDNAPFAADDAAWSGDSDPSPLLARFAGWQGDARALLAAAGSWRRWPLIHSDPLPAWTAGRVALLGDAAHPMLPFMAQGAAQAIEDADALGGALQGVAPQAADIARALIIYAGIRRPRASRVQRQSRLQGQIYHLSGAAALARDAAMRTLGGDGMLSRYDWVYAVPNAER